MSDLDQPERAKFIMRMVLAPDIKELRAVWSSFPQYVRELPDMIAFKDKLKEQFDANHAP